MAQPTSPVTVGAIRSVLESAYPPRLAESWDKVGLVCGDPAAEVTKVAFALDCTQQVAERAVEMGAQLLVVHHPLLLRGVNSVAADTPKGMVIHTLISGGCALFAAHTNADSARPGVNDRLAELLGVHPGRPIEPVYADRLDKWGFQVPESDADAVKQAIFAAGAGGIGNYRCCAFQFSGRGQFTPVAGANPTLGEVGTPHVEPEARVEFVAERWRREAIQRALRTAHPYEEVAFDVVELAPTDDLEHACGLGRVGELDTPMTLREFTQRVADRLPTTAWGVRAAGDPDRIIRTVAVASGAGDSFLGAAAKLGVDCYVTSDLRHHPVDEQLRESSMTIIDTAHWASEFPWTSQAAGIVESAVGERGVACEVINIRTDPWTLQASAAQ